MYIPHCNFLDPKNQKFKESRISNFAHTYWWCNVSQSSWSASCRPHRPSVDCCKRHPSSICLRWDLATSPWAPPRVPGTTWSDRVESYNRGKVCNLGYMANWVVDSRKSASTSRMWNSCPTTSWTYCFHQPMKKHKFQINQSILHFLSKVYLRIHLCPIIFN